MVVVPQTPAHGEPDVVLSAKTAETRSRTTRNRANILEVALPYATMTKQANRQSASTAIAFAKIGRAPKNNQA